MSQFGIADSESEMVRERRPYRPPQVVVYGSLRELTEAGAGVSGENQTSQNPNKRP